jgi:hypothetical protein
MECLHILRRLLSETLNKIITNNQNMKDTLNKIAKLNEQLNELTDQLKTEFNNALKQIFIDNPSLERISMYVNNHEFNDGDATTFYIGWEDMTITVDGEEISREWDCKTNDYTKNPILDNLIELFCQVQDLHEDIYGDAYQDLTISRSDIV